MSQDLRERCSYLLILFKAKDKALFEKFSAQLAKISAGESVDFYNYLLLEYKKLVEGPQMAQPQKPVVKDEIPVPVPVKKVAKKVAKKTIKKSPPKKKVATKKVAKKVTKKTVKKKVKKR